MKPIFLAAGPAFKTGGYQAANIFETKDLYAIMAHVVGITPAKTNATLGVMTDIFADPTTVGPQSTTTTKSTTKTSSKPTTWPNQPNEGLNQKLLVVSFDGFRDMYLEKTFLPTFNSFEQQGVISHHIQSIFPSHTYPNHWAIVTGMYAESHGIVGNKFYDPNMNKNFSFGSTDTEFWDQADPIWVTAKKQGKKTAVAFWPGMEVDFHGYKPDFSYPRYDGSVSFEDRIDQMIKWLRDDDADLGLLYFNEPDHTGHNSGPDSKPVLEKLEKMDWYFSYLLQQLETNGMGLDQVNVVICADHGMVNVTERPYIGDYTDMNNIEMVTTLI